MVEVFSTFDSFTVIVAPMQIIRSKAMHSEFYLANVYLKFIKFE